MTLTFGSPMFTAKQVARRLGISCRSVWRHVASGRLPKPYYPTPRGPRWDPDELAAALRQSRV